MTNLKKIMVNCLIRITSIMVVLLMILYVFIQITSEQRKAMGDTKAIFKQVEQILKTNEEEISAIKEEYKNTCLNNMQMVSFIIDKDETLISNSDELIKIAELLEIDEIHIIDKNGRIYSGTHPGYYGYTFDSGEQIGFFKPMLKDKTLEMIQEITPNTAEGKMMQYSAMWSENKKYIIQIGVEPIKLFKATSKNELSYIFSLLRANTGVNLVAVNKESGEIKGSTRTEFVGKTIEQIGIALTDISSEKMMFHAKVDGVNRFCIFMDYGENYIGRFISNDTLYGNIPHDTIILGGCLLIIAMILVFTVSRYISKFVLDDIDKINISLRKISSGNLEEKINIHSSTEFSELSKHINDMIDTLLSSTDKISHVINHANLSIGVYEYSEKMHTVRFTDFVPEILNLNKDKKRHILKDINLFTEYIQKIKENPFDEDECIFKVSEKKEKYIKLDEVAKGNEILGIVIDVSKDVATRKKIEAERDIDTLTGLYNRRGLDNKLEILFRDPSSLGKGALVMIDADGLKGINDKYGHEKGDIYLKKIAQVINNFGIKNSVSARQGGDEFILFLYDYEDEKELLNTIKTLEYIQNNSTVALKDNVSVPLRFSFGYSMIDSKGDYYRLLKEADEKMYQNKLMRRKENK